MAGLSFVTLLAYDWKFAFAAIRSYYPIADEIILGLDADRISWSKKPFPFDDAAVGDLIAKIDKDKKIRVIEGNFHSHDVAMENDTTERQQLGAACRAGNWVVQIDADEILLNPLEFKQYMDSAPEDICIWGVWLPVYKVIGKKALIVGGVPERAPVATRAPHQYRFARITGQPYALSPLQMLHLAFCRTEEELVQKLTNWSHSHQVDVEKNVSVWRATNLENYHELKDFHPFHGPLWPYLTVMDWPGSPLDGAVSFQLQPAGAPPAPPKPQVNQLIVEGKASGGGMAITFGTPSAEGKGPLS
jgi:hypothetical protein